MFNSGTAGTRQELDSGGQHGGEHGRGEGEFRTAHSSAGGEGPGYRQDMIQGKHPIIPQTLPIAKRTTGQYSPVQNGLCVNYIVTLTLLQWCNKLSHENTSSPYL